MSEHVRSPSLRGLAYRALAPFGRRLANPSVMPRLWFVPPLLWFRTARYAPPLGAWERRPVRVPEELRGVPGIPRRPDEEATAAERGLHRDWVKLHAHSVRFIFQHGWRFFLPPTPRKQRGQRAARRIERAPVGTRASDADPGEVTAALKALAAELGISACGVARHDPNYTFAEYVDKQVGDRVVICAMELHYEMTQSAPSAGAERAQGEASNALLRRMNRLAEHLKAQGYAVRPHQGSGDGLMIHYAVDAGLGQLGLNGQLLTPHAGSRCRLAMLNTDAPLVLDQPVDHGVPKLCDACQVCVRRCPGGAITSKRRYHRGVEKATIRSHRCVPVVAQADHCAVCMKVCPVQRYGLHAVLEEYERSGQVLGKGTDDLEGYAFDGTYYEAGERPRLGVEYFSPPGLDFDPNRQPAGAAGSRAGYELS